MTPYGVGPPIYLDRRDAGRRLAAAVSAAGEAPGTILGLARGGVPVAAELARSLSAPLDAIAVRKIALPDQPEFALGAVAANGPVYFPDALALRGRARRYVEALISRTEADALALDGRLHADVEPLHVGGGPCTLVDDGLATGATMIAACRWARVMGASRVIAAMPVASRAGADDVSAECDTVVCPHEVDDLRAVSVWYRDFRATPEAGVIALLQEAREREQEWAQESRSA